MNDVRLSPSFWLSELTASQTATRRQIDNTPPPVVLSNLRGVLAPGLQRIRDLLGVPVLVSSGYRSPSLNAAVGGSRTSQHVLGFAADFTAPEFGSPRRVAEAIVGRVGYDQLIFEGTWVHVSFVPAAARAEVLTAHFVGGSVTYSRGLT